MDELRYVTWWALECVNYATEPIDPDLRTCLLKTINDIVNFIPIVMIAPKQALQIFNTDKPATPLKR